jgi:glycosyltransferase involved in cell wall biosynthesis
MSQLVSILIPAYNSQDWIGDTIRSALVQTWPRKEIVIVDDGSTDNTLTIARSFASAGVMVVTQENQGASAARNHAFSLCQGDYIQWLDADDLLGPEKISAQMNALDRCLSERTVLSSAYGMFIYRWWKANFTPSALWCDLAPAEWLLRRWEQNLYMQPATWLASRELTEAAGPWNTRLSLDDDGEYFTRVVLASDGIKFVPEGRVFYRRGFDSLSYMGRSNKKCESQYLSIELQVSYFRTLPDNAGTRAACLKFLQQWYSAFFPERMDLADRLVKLADELGGELELPRMSAKYQWIQKAFGWNAAKGVQLRYNQIKSLCLRGWDRTLFVAEGKQAKTV